MKVLMFATALIMTTLVACDRSSPETKLNEQRMEDTKEFKGDVNKATKDRNKDLREANEDFIEEKED